MAGKEHNIEHCLICGLLLASNGQCLVCDAGKVSKSATIPDVGRKLYAKLKTETKKGDSKKIQKIDNQAEFQSAGEVRSTQLSNPAFLFNKTTKERFELCRTVVKVGRDHTNDVAIAADHHISRYHAWILHSKGRFWVEDLGSTNGTLLNGKPVAVRALLAAGDRLTFGKTELIFVVD